MLGKKKSKEETAEESIKLLLHQVEEKANGAIKEINGYADNVEKAQSHVKHLNDVMVEEGKKITKRTETFDELVATNYGELILKYGKIFTGVQNVNQYVALLHLMFPEYIERLRRDLKKQLVAEREAAREGDVAILVNIINDFEGTAGNYEKNMDNNLICVPLAIGFERSVSGKVEVWRGNAARCFIGHVKEETWIPLLMPRMIPILFNRKERIVIKAPAKPVLWILSADVWGRTIAPC